MKKIKLLLGSLGAFTVLPAMTALSAGCGNGSNKDVDYVEPNERVAVINKNAALNEKLGLEQEAQSMVLITDSGRVKDKSFNQSSWEALNTIWDQTNHKADISAIQSNGNYEASYKQALAAGKKVWILSGFGHLFNIPKFIEQNAEKLKENKTKIITIDFGITEAQKHGVEVYSLEYLVQEAGWMAGRSAAKFLNEKYPETAADMKRLAAFGGGAEAGVTAFITGYLKGMISYNEANPDKKVKTNKDSLPLTSGFEPGNEMTNVIQNVIAHNDSKVVLPVAGPATGILVEQLDKKENDNTYVIGVDVDQAESIPASAKRFMTSIMKNLGQSVYDVLLKKVYGIDVDSLKPLGDTTSYKLGFSANWVGLSKTHLPSEDGTKMQAALDEAIADFKALSAEEKAFISSNKATKDGEELQTQDELVHKLQELVNN